MTSRRVLLLFLPTLALAAPPPAGAAPADDAAARAAVDSYSLGNLDALERLERVIDARRADVGTLAPALRSGALPRRWAATYVSHVLARDAADRRLLRERLRRDRDPSIRALAGFALLGAGDSEAIPPLIALLEVRRPIIESDPPTPITRLVADRLAFFTGQDFERPSAWRAWSRRVRGKLRFDRARHRYRTRARATRSATAAAAPRHVVQFNLQIIFQAGTPRATRRRLMEHIRDAERFLNGAGRTGRCTPLEFRIDARADAAGAELDDTRFPFYVNEANTDSATWRTSFVKADLSSGRLFTSQAVDPDLGAIVIAHELLHTLRLPDEYYRPAGAPHATSIDPTSIMGGVGQVLQRHLDAIAQSQAPDDSTCERRSLRIPKWTSVIEPFTEERLSRRINHLGATAVASIAAAFWLDQDGGQITPAGDRPCGRADGLLPGAQSRAGGLTAPCADAGGNSVTTSLRVDPGSASCPSSRLESRRGSRGRFTTSVGGQLRGEELRLVLKPDPDERQTLTAHCRPAARPFEQSYQLVGNGMRFAKALSFTVPASGGTRSFERTGTHRRASGTVSVTRLP